MGLIPQEDIDKVIEANDLVSVAGEFCPDIKMRGGKFVACCPFHKEKTPSFQIDPNLQLWHCFGCGEGGNIVTFVEKACDMNFVETIEYLAHRANIQISRTAGKPSVSRTRKNRLIDACNQTMDFYHNQLTRVKSAGSNSARKYLGGRGFGQAVSKRWKLGYAPGNNALTRFLLNKGFSAQDLIDANLCVNGRDGKLRDRFFNRVMFPIFDVRDNTIAFGGRIMGDGQPKYLNSSENILFHKSKVLYGLNVAKANMTATGTAIVVEGYTDVIAMHEAGINYTVATLGTALTKFHIRALKQHAKKRIVYLFDGDEAGQRAADRALNFIDEMGTPEESSNNVELLALTLPENLDPAEYLEKYGPEEMKKLIDSAKPLIQYGIDRRFDKYDLTVMGNRSRAANEAVKILAPIKNSLSAKEYAIQIASRAHLREADVLSVLAKLKAPRRFEEDAYERRGQDGQGAQAGQGSQGAQDGELRRRDAEERELLCVMAQHPEIYKQVKEQASQVKWQIPRNGKLFEYLDQELTENPGLDAKNLIMRVQAKSRDAGNVLTAVTKLHDFRGKSDKRAMFLIYSLRMRDVEGKIMSLKEQLASGDESVYEEIVSLQNLQRELQAERQKLQI